MSNRLRGRFPNRTVSNRLPSWVLTAGGVAASLDVDFVNDRAWNGAVTSIPTIIACTRATTGSYTSSSGALSSVAINTLRYGDNGNLVEEARTNVVLYSGDLTNGVWTPSNVTVAKDQTGPDGLANSACSLTATAGNGTVLQSITLSSSARFQTAYVKRITGSGAVNMTMDNGSTWTAVTVTASWTRVSIPTQTLANPTVGFRIVTSGDAVAVAFVQNENGTAATSYIPTTSTSAARNSDAVSFNSISWFNEAAGTLYVECVENYIGSAGTYRIWDVSANSTSYGHTVSQFNGIPFYGINNNTSQASIGIGTISAGSANKWAAAYATNDAALSLNGSAVSTDASVTLPTGMLSSYVGSTVGIVVGSRYVRRIAYWPTRVSNANLVILAT